MEFYILWFHTGGTSLYFYNIQLYVSSHMSGQECRVHFTNAQGKMLVVLNVSPNHFFYNFLN